MGKGRARLIKALQDTHKPFELMLYPESRHGIAVGRDRQVQADFFFRTMLGKSVPVAEI